MALGKINSAVNLGNRLSLEVARMLSRLRQLWKLQLIFGVLINGMKDMMDKTTTSVSTISYGPAADIEIQSGQQDFYHWLQSVP